MLEALSPGCLGVVIERMAQTAMTTTLLQTRIIKPAIQSQAQAL
jgi:hypothetical protein